jgi:hypothetical protein
MQSKGAIGHKGKHNTEGEGIKSFISTILPTIIISPMIVSSPIVEEKDVVIMTDHSSEGCQPEDLQKFNLNKFLDFRAKTIETFQDEMYELKVGKDRVSTSLLKYSKSLEATTQVHHELMSYSSPSMGKGIFIAPKLITHHENNSTKSLCLNLHPYLICNLMFHYCDIVMASCQCVYHSWCLNFQLQLSTSCARKTCGKTFNE